MAPYILMFLLIAAVWIPVATDISKTEKTSYVLTFVILFLFMGFRASTVGTDTSSYLNLYVYAGQSDFSDSFNVIESAPLYTFYSWVLYQITHAEQAILIANALIICVGYGVFFYKFSENRFLCIVLFLGTYTFFGCMNAMRQNVATAFLLLAIVYLFDNRRIRALALTICAVAVHNTVIIAAILIVVAFVASRKNRVMKTNVVILVFGACFVGSLASMYLIDLFVSFFPRYSRYLLDNASVGIASANGGRTQVLWIVYLLMVFAFSMIAAVRNWLSESAVFRFLFITSIGAVSLGAIMGDFRLIMRCVSYLTPFLICFLSTSAELVDRESHTLIARMGLAAAFSIVCAAYLIGNYSDVLPYRLFF